MAFQKQVKWNVFKQLVGTRKSLVRSIDFGAEYSLQLFDGQFTAECVLDKNPSDSTDLDDFNTNYKPYIDALQPVTSDNRSILAINRIPSGFTVYPTGQSDSVISNPGFATGEELIFDADNKTKYFQLMEHWYGIGGRVIWEGADLSDSMDATLIAPATVGTNSAGDFNKYNLGGNYNMYIPASPGAGAWSLNISEKHSGTCVLKCVPVPVAGNTGYFDYNSDTNTLTVNSNGTGGYNLYDFDANLFRFCRKIWGRKIDGSESIIESTNVVGKLLYNTWKIKFVLNTTKTSGIKAGVIMTAAANKNL